MKEDGTTQVQQMLYACQFSLCGVEGLAGMRMLKATRQLSAVLFARCGALSKKVSVRYRMGITLSKYVATGFGSDRQDPTPMFYTQGGRHYECRGR